jgi:hypothetical protein
MRIATVLLQLLIAFVLTASFMPVVLVAVPAARDGTTGSVAAGLMMAALFVILALAWPRRRH